MYRNLARKKHMLGKVFVFPGPRPGPQFVFDGPGPILYLVAPASIYIYPPRSSSCIYRHWLIRITSNKSQSLRIMLLSLFLLSNSFVTVLVDRNETKINK